MCLTHRVFQSSFIILILSPLGYKTLGSYRSQSQHAKIASIASHWKWLNIYPSSGLLHSTRYPQRSLHYLLPFGKIVVHLFPTKWNGVWIIAVPNGNASGKFNLGNDSVLFSACLISRAERRWNHLPRALGKLLLSLFIRTVQCTYYRSFN